MPPGGHAILPLQDRRDAGRQLAEALRNLNLEKPVVLGIPRGGIPVAAVIAGELNGELGVAVARKIGAPSQPELAIGAVTARGPAYIDQAVASATGAGPDYIEAETERQRAEALRREEAYRSAPISLAGRDVVVVDDGIATGATAIAALRAVREAGARRVILAVPVGPAPTLANMKHEADDVVCPNVPADFIAVGLHYVHFAPPSDAELQSLLGGSTTPGGGPAI